jgi:hypothetical protein
MAITTSILGKVRYNVRGEYSTSGTYTIDDIVTYVGAQYLCKANNTGGASVPGIASAAIWEKLTGLTRERGAWSSATSYQVNDIVTTTTEYAYNSNWRYYDTDTWICRTANSNNDPRTTTAWSRLSSGSSYRKNAFLSYYNEGYSAPYKPIWNAKSQSVLGTINTLYITSAGSLVNVTNTIQGRKGSPVTGMLRLTASGGGGSGFVGVAHINGSGTCFQCEIIDPGSGYTSIPTISVDTTVSGYTGVVGGGSLPTFACYVTTNATNGATGTAALVGMGDSIGPAKAYGTHETVQNTWRYVNRRGQLVNFGANNNGSGCSSQGSYSSDSGDYGDTTITQGQFMNLDYLDGVLATPDGEYPKVMQVESYGYGTLVLFNNGEVHYSGYNGYGESGINYTPSKTNAAHRCGYGNINKSGTSVLRGKKAIRIACSGGGDSNSAVSNYALIENTDGTRELWSWGYNGYGQLGLNDTTARNVPTQISFSQAVNGRILEIWSTGGNYAQLFILTDQGKMFACGYNGYGNLGNGNATNQYTLVQVDANSWGVLTGSTGKLKKFSLNGGASSGSYCAIKQDNSLYTWGYNGYGQLAHNHLYNCYIPVKVYTNGYTGSSNPVTTTGNQGTPSGTALADTVNAWMLGGNGYQYLAATRGSTNINNTLYMCGYNGYYNLGDNTTTNRSVLQIVQINNSSNATNVMECVSNQGHSSSYISGAFYRYNSTWAGQVNENWGEWYVGAYDVGVMSTGTSDSYNERQDLDPNRLSGNYRYKNNIQETFANKGNWFFSICGSSASKSGFWADFKNGIVYMTQTTSVDNYVRAVHHGTPNGRGARAAVMRRIRHAHM